MKNKALLTAGLVILVCSCLFAGIYNYKSVNCEEQNHSVTYVSSVDKQESDEEEDEFIIWNSIPRYLLMINR